MSITVKDAKIIATAGRLKCTPSFVNLVNERLGSAKHTCEFIQDKYPTSISHNVASNFAFLSTAKYSLETHSGLLLVGLFSIVASLFLFSMAFVIYPTMALNSIIMCVVALFVLFQFAVVCRTLALDVSNVFVAAYLNCVKMDKYVTYDDDEKE